MYPCNKSEGKYVLGLRAPRRSKLEKGKVKWFSEKKGYGFIVPDDGSDDLFVHHSNIAVSGFRTLEEGQKVEYEAAQGKKGPEARNVRPY